MSVAETIHNIAEDGSHDKKTKVANGGVAFKVFDDIKKSNTRPRRQEERNNLANSSDNVYKNHHYYHKNCFAPADNFNTFTKFTTNKKENNTSKEFFNSLDSKLRNLHAPRQKRSTKTSLENRPMFVTTVKTGIFLEPPPEIAAILGLQSFNSSVNGSSGSTGSLHPSNNGDEVIMYSFASHPRVVNQRNARTRAVPPRENKNKNGNNNSNNNNNNNVNARKKRDLNATPPKKT